MEKSFDIQQKKVQSVEVLKIIHEHKDRPNKDLKLAMDFIKEDFEHAKENVIKLTHHLDKLEQTYNVLLKEYERRNNISKL